MSDLLISSGVLLPRPREGLREPPRWPPEWTLPSPFLRGCWGLWLLTFPATIGGRGRVDCNLLRTSVA